MNKLRQQKHIESDDQLNQQINDKLNQLWTGMKNKKKQMIRNLTPSYSRRSQRTLSQLNTTNNQLSGNYSTQNQAQRYANNTLNYMTQANINQSQSSNMYNQTQNTQNQLLKIKQKLASQQSSRKTKQNEISHLKTTITQLMNDKKILMSEIHQQRTKNSISVCNLNYQNQYQHQQSSNIENSNVDGRTANFSTNKKKSHSQNKQKKQQSSMKKQKSFKKYYYDDQQNKQNQNNINTKQKLYANAGTLEDLEKQRLIQLLKSTSQYRQFAFYYNCHELSYLKRLQTQHKKNCSINQSQIQKKYWAPNDLLNKMKKLNRTRQLNLNQDQVQQIVGEMKTYFQSNQNQKIKQIKNQYLKKIQKIKRQNQNNVPYDLVRLSNAKQRQIYNYVANKKRGKSIIKS